MGDRTRPDHQHPAGPHTVRFRIDGSDGSSAVDETILARMVRRDPASLAVLHDRYSGLAFSVALRMLNDRPAAEDVVQDVFLNVWRHAATYRAERGTVRAWLLTIVRNQAINHMRAFAARGGVTADIDGLRSLASSMDTAAIVEQGYESERVREAVAMLPSNQRQVMILAYFGGLSHSEIARAIALPLGTVKGRLRLALKRLRSALPEMDAAPTEMRSVLTLETNTIAETRARSAR